MSAMNPKIAIVGVGAVGGTVGGWLAPWHEKTYFIDHGKVAQALRAKGLTLYQSDDPDNRKSVPINMLDDISEIADADFVIIAVKTYSLDSVAKAIQSKTGDRPVIVALQNGVDNQSILSKYFTKVIYGVVGYNAWLDEPGVIGYQKKGPLVLGSIGNALAEETKIIASILSQGVDTVITDRIQDAARSKMIINLTNSFTTLVGHRFKKISNDKLFQKLLTNLTFEGVQIMKAAGVRECRVGGMPSWLTLTAAAKLPLFMTRPLFRKNVKKMVLSSMAQDILQRGGSETELEALNGYFLKIADQHGLRVPYNRAIYALCKERFAKPAFEPLDVTDVWRRVQDEMGKAMPHKAVQDKTRQGKAR